MDNFIEIKDLTYWYGEDKDLPVIRNVNLTIRKGEFVAVVGPNGSGKSTLVRHINGLLTPCAGSVIVAGLDTSMAQNLPAIRHRVGMVFQNPDNQLFASVVEEDVAFGPENLCLPREEIRDRVEQALALVGLLEYRLYPPHRLSGGQKQKAAIAGVLAMRPDCIILDEPTSMLDPKGRKEVLEAVKDLNIKHGITAAYVTHDMAEALLFPRMIALFGGEVVFDGNPDILCASTDLLRRAGLHAPDIRELVNGLIKEGVRLPQNVNSPEELVDILCP